MLGSCRKGVKCECLYIKITIVRTEGQSCSRGRENHVDSLSVTVLSINTIYLFSEFIVYKTRVQNRKKVVSEHFLFQHTMPPKKEYENNVLSLL